MNLEDTTRSSPSWEQALTAAADLLSHFWNQAEALQEAIDDKLHVQLQRPLPPLSILASCHELKVRNDAEYDRVSAVLRAWRWRYSVRNRSRGRPLICDIDFIVRATREHGRSELVVPVPYLAIAICESGFDADEFCDFEVSGDLWDGYQMLSGPSKAFAASVLEVECSEPWERVAYFPISIITDDTLETTLIKPIVQLIATRASRTNDRSWSKR